MVMVQINRNARKDYVYIILKNVKYIIQVYINLQPLNICMSYQGTLNLIEKISEDHDVEVQYWCDQMKDYIVLRGFFIVLYEYHRRLVYQFLLHISS